MPFDPLVSSGVPKGFPEQLHIIESDNSPVAAIVSENNDFQEDSEDNTTNDSAKMEVILSIFLDTFLPANSKQLRYQLSVSRAKQSKITDS